MITNAIPVWRGTFSKKRSSALRPPADAPIPTTRNGVLLAPGSVIARRPPIAWFLSGTRRLQAVCRTRLHGFCKRLRGVEPGSDVVGRKFRDNECKKFHKDEKIGSPGRAR